MLRMIQAVLKHEQGVAFPAEQRIRDYCGDRVAEPKKKPAKEKKEAVRKLSGLRRTGTIDGPAYDALLRQSESAHLGSLRQAQDAVKAVVSEVLGRVRYPRTFRAVDAHLTDERASMVLEVLNVC
jgi:hypothetical protein